MYKSQDCTHTKLTSFVADHLPKTCFDESRVNLDLMVLTSHWPMRGVHVYIVMSNFMISTFQGRRRDAPPCWRRKM